MLFCKIKKLLISLVIIVGFLTPLSFSYDLNSQGISKYNTQINIAYAEEQGWGEWFVSGIGEIILFIPKQIFFMGEVLFNWSFKETLINFAENYKSGNFAGFDFKKAVNDAWNFTRNLANIVLISLFVFSAVATILRLTNFELKTFIVKLIVVALLVNFSMFFVKIAIDISNAVAYSLQPKVTNTNQNENTNQLGFASYFRVKLGIDTITNDVAKNLKWTDSLLIYIVGAFAISVAAGVLIYASVVMLSRFLGLLLIMALSAIGFVAMIIPKIGDKYFKMWWENLLRYSIFAPVFALSLSVVAIFLESIDENSKANLGQIIASEIKSGGSIASAIFLMFIIIGLFYASVKIADSLSLAGSKLAVKYGFGGAMGLGTLPLTYLYDRTRRPLLKTAGRISDAFSSMPIVGKSAEVLAHKLITESEKNKALLGDTKLADLSNKLAGLDIAGLKTGPELNKWERREKDKALYGHEEGKKAAKMEQEKKKAEQLAEYINKGSATNKSSDQSVGERAIQRAQRDLEEERQQAEARAKRDEEQEMQRQGQKIDSTAQQARMSEQETRGSSVDNTSTGIRNQNYYVNSNEYIGSKTNIDKHKTFRKALFNKGLQTAREVYDLDDKELRAIMKDAHIRSFVADKIQNTNPSLSDKLRIVGSKIEDRDIGIIKNELASALAESNQEYRKAYNNILSDNEKESILKQFNKLIDEQYSDDLDARLALKDTANNGNILEAIDFIIGAEKNKMKPNTDTIRKMKNLKRTIMEKIENGAEQAVKQAQRQNRATSRQHNNQSRAQNTQTVSNNNNNDTRANNNTDNPENSRTDTSHQNNSTSESATDSISSSFENELADLDKALKTEPVSFTEKVKSKFARSVYEKSKKILRHREENITSKDAEAQIKQMRDNALANAKRAKDKELAKKYMEHAKYLNSILKGEELSESSVNTENPDLSELFKEEFRNKGPEYLAKKLENEVDPYILNKVVENISKK